MRRRLQPVLRAAVAADAEALTALARRAKASWGYPDAWLREWAPQLAFDAEYIAGERVLVAELDGRIVGVVAVELSGDGAEIGHLWVDPEAQGRGVGRALLERAAEVARETGARALRIVSDPHARPFYERLGATVTGEVDAPVAGTPRTLPLMRLTL